MPKRERTKDRKRERISESPVEVCGNLAKLILERAPASITVNCQRQQVQESMLDFGQKQGA